MEQMTFNMFNELTVDDLEIVEGGGICDFAADIYDRWCDMWYDFGANLYYAFH